MSGILVTGARGFLGGAVLEILAARGAEVHAVSSAPHPEAPGSVRWHQADLLVPGAARALVARIRPEALLHLAWCTEPPGYWSSPLNYPWVEASAGLVREFVASGGRRVLGVGSCAEYDWRYGYCSEELTPLAPGTTYGVCKDAFRRIMERMCADAGVPAAWARLFHLYGPGERPVRLVPAVVLAGLRGEAPRLAEPGAVRDFLHVRDAADALVSLLQSGVTGAVNVGSGIPVSVTRVAQTILDLMGSHLVLDAAPPQAPPGSTPLLVADVRRLTSGAGWRPRIDLHAGLGECIDWWRAREAS
jgi:nucleoside-diphosphate-sugar epimerase